VQDIEAQLAALETQLRGQNSEQLQEVAAD